MKKDLKENAHNECDALNQYTVNMLKRLGIKKTTMQLFVKEIPKVVTLLETSMMEIVNDFITISDNSKKQNNLIDEVSNLLHMNIKENENLTLLEGLKRIADNPNQEINSFIKELIILLEKEENQIYRMLNLAQSSIEETNNSISRIIINTQFQDRVSQHLMIIFNSLKIMSDSIEVFEKDAKKSLDGHKLELDYEYLNKQVSLLKMGELRDSFVHMLIDNGYANNIDELKLEASNNPNLSKSQEDDIDLF